MPKKTKSVQKKQDVATRVATMHLAKSVHKCTFKKRAPTAIKALRTFVSKQMGTADVRLDPSVNKFLWSRGIRSVPRRVRVQMARKVNEEGNSLYTVVSLIALTQPSDFRGLKTEKI